MDTDYKVIYQNYTMSISHLSLPSLKLLFLCSICLTSCQSSILVSSTGSKKEELKKYKTFAWASIDHKLDTIKTINARGAELTIKKEVNRHLEKKGLVMQALEPDLIIDYIFLVRRRYSYNRELESEKLNVDMNAWDTPTTNYLLSPEVYNPKKSLDQEFTLVENQNIEESLTILIKDPKTDLFIWKGNCKQLLEKDDDPILAMKPAIKKLLQNLDSSKKQK